MNMPEEPAVYFRENENGVVVQCGTRCHFFSNAGSADEWPHWVEYIRILTAENTALRSYALSLMDQLAEVRMVQREMWEKQRPWINKGDRKRALKR